MCSQPSRSQGKRMRPLEDQSKCWSAFHGQKALPMPGCACQIWCALPEAVSITRMDHGSAVRLGPKAKAYFEAGSRINASCEASGDQTGEVSRSTLGSGKVRDLRAMS